MSGRDESTSRADPDSRARTHLANERTFLAWIRTAITFITLGLAAAQFLDTDRVLGVPLSAYLAIVLVCGGIGLALVGRRRFVVGQERIERGIPQFGTRDIAVVSTFVIVVGIFAIAFVLIVNA